jgi:AP-2 complex subunit alpha
MFSLIDMQRHDSLWTHRNSKSFVKKKAALTMLRLFRKHPDVIPAPDWAERITNIIDDYDLGVCLAVTSLVTALAQQYPESFMMAVPKAIMRLHKVSDLTLKK